MSTRLDRLFLLLDTGSTPVTRRAAAQQLGDVQKLHPHELPILLAKVHAYLRYSSWDTRIAAGHAVDAIARNVPQWTSRREESYGSLPKISTPVQRDNTDRLQFSRFDVARMLQHGASLLGSAGTEYEMDIDENLDPKERLAKQRRQLQKKLGLDVAGMVGMATDDLFNDDDLADPAPVPMATASSFSRHPSTSNSLRPPSTAADAVAQELTHLGQGLSNREKNRAKRKAKLLAKQRSKENSDSLGSQCSMESTLDEPGCKKPRLGSVIIKQASFNESRGVSEDSAIFAEEVGEWPFASFCEQLSNDLFHPSWEVRHGAATGLREVLKTHGKSAGKSAEYANDQQDSVNHSWLEDMALRFLCVLSLDRFGDFVSDEVVAPVRETCAQALGVVLRHMSVAGVQGVLGVLLQLLSQKQWEVRHGGLLGLKYLLAVRKEMTDDLLPSVLPSIIQGLQDVDDDVRAVAAASLNPVAESLIKVCKKKVPVILNTLWDTLLDLDDLTASTNSIMMLLASLLSYPLCSQQSSHMTSLTNLVPRLWPFLRHGIMSVRKAALDTFLRLLDADNQQFPPNVWLPPILQDALRHMYQRSLLETNQDILDLIEKVWDALLSKSPLEPLVACACPWISGWMCLAMQPSHLPFEAQMLIEAKHKTKESHKSLGKSWKTQQTIKEDDREYIAGEDTLNAGTTERTRAVLQARIRASRLLGKISSYITSKQLSSETNTMESFAQILIFHLSSKSAVQRMVVGLVIEQWAQSDQLCQCPETVKAKVLEVLSSSVYFDEVSVPFMKMQTECKNLVSCWCDVKPQVQPSSFPSAFTVEQANGLAQGILGQLPSVSASIQDDVLVKCRHIQASVQNINEQQHKLSIRTQACLASALVSLKYLPDKLNPVIRPLMDSIKKEEIACMQSESATSLARLLQLCISRTPCPNPKIIKNLCNSVCGDSNHTPSAMEPVRPLTLSSMGSSLGETGRPSSPLTVTPPVLTADCDKHNGIVTLVKQQQAAAIATASRRAMFSKSRSRDSHLVDLSSSLTSVDLQDEIKDQNRLQRRGAEFGISTLARHFEGNLVTSLGPLWQAVVGPLYQHVNLEKFDRASLHDNDCAAQELVNSFQILEVLGPAAHVSLQSQLCSLLSYLILCLQYPYTAVRHMAARCLGMLSQVITTATMNEVLAHVVPTLGATDDDVKRQGALEALSCIIDRLGIDIVPYIVLLVVPLLGQMSDQIQCIRLLATQSFATLIRLMPLEAGIPDPPSMTKALIEQKARERRFLEQLLDGSKLDNYAIPVPIKAELRRYQQDGVNWLAFLNKYKLHGILCDDMGLGKTLMSICIMAGDYYLKQQHMKSSSAADGTPLPCIVVCPPTLTGHWVYEVKKFCSTKYLNPLHYTGPPMERVRLRGKVKKHNLVVVSYDIVRNDIDFFRTIKWNYCILDEGHIIKNGRTKLAKAIKQLPAANRLILSGTPIQNNVLELWSLFDFLMPGFLGTEKQFSAKYAKPIIQSRDAKSSSKEQEAGALAMEALHRQVLPFVLRRLKEDVLDDLPPKIIQDYYCELSPLQIQLYEDFARSRARKGVENTIHDAEKDAKKATPATTHIFQALQYLRKVCNHPLLVVNTKHPQYEHITKQLKEQRSSLHDLQHSPKLTALKQLLQDCGIGGESLPSTSSGQDELTEAAVGQHRVLLFCQLKSMLDIVEKDLIKAQMPKVTYLRLDGSVPAGQRHDLVHRFNNDPSIDMLLLTTHVGGLGLNLTGADTVIFVEHDWNPTKDLQAMDRAHRIGQKKVVNVYRLITRGTLEEKIMGLQKFKLNIANTVITQDNASLHSMGTDQLLDLFSLDQDSGSSDSAGDKDKSASSSDTSKQSAKAVLQNLEDLWDEKQYETEYDLDSFMQSLHT
ncbi:TATA-binding protein-associated factor 172-like [Amphiura filiformis]|uniref:TATA-binding protein-associated factor 172-like n=1 Tax=Amphiura filiformis TaxID=82378 RepID=UPI003B213EC4